MLKGRYILATLAGVLAAAAVWCWPVAPIWRVAGDVGFLNGISANGRIVVTSRQWINARNVNSNLDVSRWDAATGKLLSRAEIPPPRPFNIKNWVCECFPSPDGAKVLVGCGSSAQLSVIDLTTGEWYLHDGVTGDCLTGPISGVNRVYGDAFSRDGRWFVAHRGDPAAGTQEAVGGIDIYSTANCERVVALPDEDGCEALRSVYAPDGTSAAVEWYPRAKDAEARRGAPAVFRIIEIPSGKERRRITFPPGPWEWTYIDRWDGRYLEVRALKPDGPAGESLEYTTIFDTAQDDLGEGNEDPVLRGRRNGGVWNSSKSGPDWLMYFTIGPTLPPPQGLAGWFDSLAVRIGAARPPLRGRQVSVRFADRQTGEVRYELPRPVDLDLHVSPDGRRLICGGGDYGIEVWDTSPPVRWHKALLGGLAAAGVILALGKLRRKRALAKAAVSPSA
jgi:hypothetical protein